MKEKIEFEFFTLVDEQAPLGLGSWWFVITE